MGKGKRYLGLRSQSQSRTKQPPPKLKMLLFSHLARPELVPALSEEHNLIDCVQRPGTRRMSGPKAVKNKGRKRN